MRTDTERLDWLLTIIERQDEEAADRLTAAHTLELRGRPMLDAAMGAKLIEPGEPMPALTAIDLAVAELGRIRNVKGFSEERDDGYDMDDLAGAGACYLLPHLAAEEWPWGLHTFKPSPDDRKKELTKGIALAVCELDRLIRAERRDRLEDQAADAESQAIRPGDPAALEDADHGFKVGEDVTYPNLDTGLRDRGEYRGRNFGGLAQVAVAGGTTLLFPYAELGHVDG